MGIKHKALRALALLLTILVVTPLFGCSVGYSKPTEEKIKIVCTLFPQYDWLKNIVNGSEKIELSLLIANGADPHSYQPTASDIMEISSCDMIVFVGGDSDTWVKEALERAKNAETQQIKLMELDGITLHNISAVSEEHDHNHNHSGHDHGTFDEHIWLSLKNAIAATEAMTDKLCELDAKNAELYRQNSADYIQRLTALDQRFSDLAQATPTDRKFVIFADRFPFVYLLSDYGIGYQAAFEGCSADVDAGFDTVLELIHEAELHNAAYIGVTESSDKALAQTVANSAKHTDIKILTFNSMQSVSRRHIESGTSYMSIMEENFAVLSTALYQSK